jgi:hypothetical protein
MSLYYLYLFVNLEGIYPISLQNYLFLHQNQREFYLLQLHSFLSNLNVLFIIIVVFAIFHFNFFQINICLVQFLFCMRVDPILFKYHLNIQKLFED